MKAKRLSRMRVTMLFKRCISIITALLCRCCCFRARSVDGHGHKHAEHAFDSVLILFLGQMIAKGKVAVHVFDYRLDPCLVRKWARNRSFLVFRLLGRFSGFI
jgi:hypothetical protein